MKFVIAILAFFACALALSEPEYQEQFTSWMQVHGKSYNHDEFLPKYRTWKSNMDFIESHNARNLGFTVAMNKFGDLSLDEYRTFYLGLLTDKINVTAVGTPSSSIPTDLPDSWDWREKNAVTAVKDQAQCGSCWAFSTTGSTEGCNAIANKADPISLSEQNLMDCSWKQGNQGCNGGLMTSAMDYIVTNQGIDTEASYPYRAKDSHTCLYKEDNKGATLKAYTNVKTGDEKDLAQKVYTGPTSVAIDAAHSSFQFYHTGVYYEAACSSSRLDHGVLGVGWGSVGNNGTNYWIVKNSWGVSWGNKGYIWMSKSRSNNCGIATMSTLPSC